MRTTTAFRTLASLEPGARFDVVVVGGGITGVQVARELAMAGRHVLLLEASDFGSGTSSATTKYIHGGIRYLETREFGVVRESLRERRLLALAAPHLVAQQSFVMPAWRWSKPGAALIGLGMGLYSTLAFDRNRDMPRSLHVPRPRWLGRREVERRAPWIRRQDLLGGWEYHDTLNQFPERLLLEFLHSALAAGATAVNYAKVTRILMTEGDHGVVTGVDATDTLDGTTRTISAPVVVNASGPWVDSLIPRHRSTVQVKRSKGVHVLTNQIPGYFQRSTIFARAESGRHVVVSPWQNRLLIGPTDTPMAEDMSELQVDRADVDLVLDVFNETTNPEVPRMGTEDVIEAIVGVRPLISEGSASTYKASRRHDIRNHADDGMPGLYSLLGGKWTTGRATAEDLANRLTADGWIPRGQHLSTRNAPVTSSFGWGVDPAPFLDEIQRTARHAGVHPANARHLAGLYGTSAESLIALCFEDPSLANPISTRPNVLDIGAQVYWAVAFEGARTLSDIIDRRLSLGTIGDVSIEETRAVAGIAGPLLGLDPEAAARAEAARRSVLRQTWSR